MKHLFVVNPRALPPDVTTDEFAENIRGAFRHSDDPYELFFTRFARDAIPAVRKFAAEAGESEIKRVYSVGGDGMLFDIVNAVYGLKNIQIGIIPFGVENDFVKVFGAENFVKFLNIKRQIVAKTIPVDILKVDAFVTPDYVSLGMECHVAYLGSQISNAWRGLFKRPIPSQLSRLRYITAFILTLFNRHAIYHRYVIEIDGEHYDGQYASINIANHKYVGGSMVSVPEADCTDGEFDALFTRSTAPFGLFTLFGKHIKGRWKENRSRYIYVRGKQMRISSDTPMRLCLNGQYVYRTEVEIEILHGFAEVIAPID
ncbi:MAG: hypothetical protein LBN40_03220 [Oscillospiraceae bacterium]|jgi:diacylglycerol kinase family enzyme|nr:hypothetical protein [Oscillospiraceae bacterium]